MTRDIFTKELNSKPAERFKLWMYLLAHVQYQDYGTLSRGQGYFKYDNIGREINISYNSIPKFIKRAEKKQMLARQQKPRGVVITITNYDTYQDYGKAKAKQKQSRSKAHIKDTDNTDNTNKGKYVKLSDKEMQRLIEDFGELAVLSKIEDVNNYCGSHGKKYKDYNLTIRSWFKKDGISKKTGLSEEELGKMWYSLSRDEKKKYKEIYGEEKINKIVFNSVQNK